MKRKATGIVFGVMLSMAFVLTGCSGSGTSGETQTGQEGNGSKAVLRVGMECENPPYNWSQTDDSKDRKSVV